MHQPHTLTQGKKLDFTKIFCYTIYGENEKQMPNKHFKHSYGQILNYLSVCDFSYPLHENNYEEHIIEPLQEKTNFKFTYELGSSKLCIIPREGGYVIKIPLSGTFNYSDTFSPFSYTKVDENGNESYEWDYCQIDTDVYAAACSKALDIYFAAVQCIGEINSYPIYVQPKVEIWTDFSLSLEAETFICNKTKELKAHIFCPSWMMYFYNLYGEEEYKRLFDFIESYPIEDLHYLNVGTIEGKPVLVDYSGYYG